MVRYAGDEKEDREAQQRYMAAIERAQKENQMHVCDMCHIPYPEPCMKRITPDKLCRACDIRRGIEK